MMLGLYNIRIVSKYETKLLVLQGVCLPVTPCGVDFGFHLHTHAVPATPDDQQVGHPIHVHAYHECGAGRGVGFPGIGVS